MPTPQQNRIIQRATKPELSLMTGLQLWLRADALGGVSDGAAVAAWPITGGASGALVTQGTAAQQSLWRATGGPNGKPALDFDGTNDNFDLGAISVASGSTSFYIVANPTAASSASGMYFFDTTTGRIIIAQNCAAGSFNQVGWFDGTWRQIAAATTGNQLLTWVLTSGGNGEVFRNGVSLGTAAYSAKAIGSTTTLSVAATVPFLGKISEFLIYSTAHSTAERLSVEAYLNQKYVLY
jgi:hypothetical protein